MATLEKIRSKGTLLLIVVGLALVTFIVGDFIGSSTTFFQQNSNNAALINGEKIKALDYMQSIDEMQEVYEIEVGSTSLNDETLNQIRESVWETTVRTNVISTEAEEIGMQVTKDELYDIVLGDNISNLISARRMFANENGVFDRNALANFISVIYSDDDSQLSAQDKAKYKTYWEFWEKTAKTTRLEEKYTNLLTKAMVVTPLEAKYAFEGKQNSYDVVYAMKNYFAIADSTIQVSESEIKSRYNKNKEQYKQEANANIKYVVFDIKPSQEDYNKVEYDINKLKREFSTTSDIAAFTNSTSDVTYTGANLTKEDIDADFAEFAFSGAKDSVMGPIFANDTYKMARIVENKINRADSVKLRNLAVLAETAEKTAALADSIMQELKNGADFATLARKHSAAQNAEQGGEIGWLREAALTNEIADKAFSAKANSYFEIEEGQAKIIFNVEEVGGKAEKVKLAVIAINVTASSQTQAALYGEAKKFAADANNQLANLEANAKEQNRQVIDAKNININAISVNNIKRGREIVRWAFENEANDVSDVIECDDKLVVAAVAEVYEKGYKTVDQVKSAITAELRNEKKGEQLVATMAGKTLEQLKAEGFNVDTVRNINFNSSYAGAIGNEPTLFGLVADNGDKVSAPIQGKMGAYVFKVINTINNPITYNEATEIAMLAERAKYSASYQIIEALKTAAEVEDFRYKYF